MTQQVKTLASSMTKESHLWGPHGRRRGQTPESCPLILGRVLRHMHSGAHAQINKCSNEEKKPEKISLVPACVISLLRDG